LSNVKFTRGDETVDELLKFQFSQTARTILPRSY